MKQTYFIIGAGVIILLVLATIFYLIYGKSGISQKSQLVSTKVESTGATLESGAIKVDVPKDSLAVGTQVSVKKIDQLPSLNTDEKYVSDVYDVEADQELQGPVTMEISFDPGKLPSGATMDNLYAAWWDGDKWIAANGFVDSQRNKLVIQTNHLSWWTALYNRVTAIWQDKMEPVLWFDVPAGLKSKLASDLKINQDDISTIEHAQFSSLTKAATFVLGLANQVANVSGILTSTESVGDLTQAVIEKIAGDVAKQGGGQVGELAVDVYEGGKTGFAVGQVIGHAVYQTGLATAELQNAAPQIIAWILDQEMKYINANTSSLFEYLSLYQSQWLGRINTYILFYDTKVAGHLRSRGAVLYYQNPDNQTWIKGKNVNTISDVLVKIIQKKTEPNNDTQDNSASALTPQARCEDVNLANSYTLYAYSKQVAPCNDYQKNITAANLSLKCKSSAAQWRNYWIKKINVAGFGKLKIKADLGLNDYSRFFSECSGQGVKSDNYVGLMVLSSDPTTMLSQECNRLASENDWSKCGVTENNSSILGQCGVAKCTTSRQCNFGVNLSGNDSVYLVFRAADAWPADVEGNLSNLNVCFEK